VSDKEFQPLTGDPDVLEAKARHYESIGEAIQRSVKELNKIHDLDGYKSQAVSKLQEMSKDTAEYAALAGVKPCSVTVGDAGTRWGSCSSEGKIRLSWRLILAPAEVRRFVVAHEVAHLRHLDHGARFKELEARLYGPGLSEAKALLRRVGPRLKRIGRRR